MEAWKFLLLFQGRDGTLMGVEPPQMEDGDLYSDDEFEDDFEDDDSVAGNEKESSASPETHKSSPGTKQSAEEDKQEEVVRLDLILLRIRVLTDT